MSIKKNIFSRFLARFKNNKLNVSIIRLNGIISPENGGFKKTNLALSALRKDIDKAFELKNLKAVALSINSPGGSPVQTELLHRYILKCAYSKKVPVYSFVEDIAASGGYWLACAGSEIYALESSILGSIGVITAGFGFVSALKKLGVERRIITQGENKSVYDPFLPAKESDKKIIEALQKDAHEAFKTAVIECRGKKLQTKKEKLFDGKFWSGKRALELGLIDGIGDLYSVMEAKYGEDVCFNIVEKEESWLKKKLGIGAIMEEVVESFIMKIRERIDFIKFGL